MTIQEYIDLIHGGSNTWFESETKLDHHRARINDVLAKRNYLNRIHKILKKPPTMWKKEEYIPRKVIYNKLLNCCNYHTMYALAKPVSIVGDDKNMNLYSSTYKNGDYSDTDITIFEKTLKYGDCGEYIYIDHEDGKKVIKSHIIDSADFFPVYSESNNKYIACIESWTINNVSHYTVYYDNIVETWDNEGSELRLVETMINLSGLPIHHHNQSVTSDLFGESFLTDIIPIMDEFELFINTFSDAVDMYSMRPIGVATGAELQTVPSEGMGYIYGLEEGSTFDWATAIQDSASIKIILDTMNQNISQACMIPTTMQGQSNIANVSGEILQIIYENTQKFSQLNQRWLRRGIRERFKIFDKLFKNQFGVVLDDVGYVDVSFNVDRPQNDSQLIDNIIKLFDKGLISRKTAIERVPIISDTVTEYQRLKDEGKFEDVDSVDKSS